VRPRFAYLVSNPRLCKAVACIPPGLPDSDKTWSTFSQIEFNRKGAIVPEETPQTGLSDNAAAALAYFTFVPAIIFLLVAPFNQKPFIRFHAWQSILLTVAAIVINIVLGIVMGVALLLLPFYLQGHFWRLIELCWLVIWIVCALKAFNGNRFKLPLIGDLAEKQAGV
jgi:uncharacterized membrane protein